MTDGTPRIVKKPWGEEVWFAETDKYAGKILRVRKGHRLSLQYHEKKDETQYLLNGKVKITYGDSLDKLSEIILNPLHILRIRPGTIHRLEALEDSEILEVSTPELDDIIKIEDDYGRNGSGNNFEQDTTLHNKHQK